MARIQLVIDAEGRMALAIPSEVEPAQLVAIKTAFAAWKQQQPPHLLIVPNAEVVRVVDVELQLPEEQS